MNNKIISAIMVMVVGVILLGSVFATTIANYSDTERTYTNVGTPFAEMDDNEHTITISYPESGKILMTADGVSINNPEFLFDNSATIVYGSEGFMRLSNNGSVRIFTETSNTVRYSAQGDVTITLSGDDVTVTGGDAADVTATIKPMAFISSEGKYTQTLNPIVDESSVLIGGSTTVSGNQYFSLVAYGSLEDLTVSMMKSSIANIAYVDYDVDSTSSGYGDLIKVNSVDFTFNDGTNDIVGHYSFFLVPKEVQYDNPDYIGSQYTGILSATIVVFIAGLLLIGVRMIISNRD